MSTEIITIPSHQIQQQQISLMRPIATPKELINYHEDMTRIIREALKENVDYGVIKGTKVPTLYKAGAERINIAFGTHPEYEIIEKEIDHDVESSWQTRFASGTAQGRYRYIYKCRIVRADGRVIAEGEGTCSTLESKYANRPRDCENTVCKMAQKRAFVAATLHAFGLSDRFTQDLEEQGHEPHASSPPLPLLFDLSNQAHREKMEAGLLARNIAPGKHMEIAKAMNGQPFSNDSLSKILAAIAVKEAEETSAEIDA